MISALYLPINATIHPLESTLLVVNCNPPVSPMRPPQSIAIFFILTTLCLLAAILAPSATWPWPLLFLLSALLPLFLNTWLVAPGGFAWRNVRFGNYALMPPGVIGWPLLGSLPLMGPLAHRKLAGLSKSCGADRLLALSLGTTPVVISSHPDTAREILCGSAFSDRPTKVSARLLMFERAIGFAPSGEYWRHLRRLAATQMFSPRRIATMEGLRSFVADKMMEEVRKVMEVKGMVRLRGVLQRGSLESILGSVFGSELSRGDKEELAEMVSEGYELISRFNWEDHFPNLGGLLDFHGVSRRCRVLAMRVKTLVGRIIEEKRSSGIGESKQDDFLTVLLSLPQEETLTDSDAIAVLWEMIFRGTDVVAILLEWIMARLVLHPDIQAKAQQELNLLVGARPVRDIDIPRLKYLQAIVKEVLRMHPPGPLLSWARLAIHDVHIGKFFVPAGTTAMVNMWAIAHNETIWKDPWAFRPERFCEEEVNVMGSDLRLAPFGSGRRVCPGRALGLATVHLWLAKFLQRFNWVSDQPVHLSECLRLSMEMKKPLICQAIINQHHESNGISHNL